MVLAEVQADVLGRSLLIAAVLVSPYAIHKYRQVRRMRSELARSHSAGDEPEPTGPSRPRLEVVIDEITDLGTSGEDRPLTVLIPHGVTIGGADAPAGLVDTLVRDALRRSGLVATAELDTARGRVLELHRIS